MKGRITRRASKNRVKVDQIEIPPEIKAKGQNLTWCFDNMFVCGMPFMTGIILDLRHRSCSRLRNRSHEEFYSNINKVCRAANAAGYRIGVIVIIVINKDLLQNRGKSSLEIWSSQFSFPD